MDIFIGHNSALEFWRACRAAGKPFYDNRDIASQVRRNNSLPQPATKPDLKTISLFGFSAHIDTRPVSLIVNDADSRVKTDTITSRVWKASSPSAFVRLDDLYLVSSPEACFAQIASDLDLIDLIELGFELCGTYSVTKLGPTYNIPPITSRASLKKIEPMVKGKNGAKTFRTAMRYIYDNSASPAETKLAMMLSLPPLYGGYGLPTPALNATINIPKHLKAAFGHASYRCDLLWQRDKEKVAVEYKSDEFHRESTKFYDDAKRNNALREMGVTIIEVTAGQLYNANEIENVARQIAKALKFQMRSTVDNQISRRYNLRKHLL